MESIKHKIIDLVDVDNLNKISGHCFDDLLGLAIENICSSKLEVTSSILTDKNIHEKQAFEDLLKLMIELGRTDIDSEEFKCILNNTNLCESHLEKLYQVYIAKKKSIQGNLETIGNSIPHIVGVNWKLDYCIKTNMTNSAGVPYYSIALSTIKYRNVEDFKFICSMQQLQELVNKLKDASKHAEKLTS